MSLEIYVPIAVAVITGSFSIVAIHVSQHKKKRVERQLKATQVELQFKHAALSFQMEATAWSHVNAELRAIFDKGVIDSFLMFCAWNGFNDPLWTTAIFQYRRGENISILHVETDNEYVQMLKHVKTEGAIVVQTQSLPDESVLKNHFVEEQIKSAAIHYFDSRKLENSDSVAVRYCSYRSTNDETLDVATLFQCKRLTDYIKGALEC